MTPRQPTNTPRHATPHHPTRDQWPLYQRCGNANAAIPSAWHSLGRMPMWHTSATHRWPIACSTAIQSQVGGGDGRGASYKILTNHVKNAPQSCKTHQKYAQHKKSYKTNPNHIKPAHIIYKSHKHDAKINQNQMKHYQNYVKTYRNYVKPIKITRQPINIM